MHKKFVLKLLMTAGVTSLGTLSQGSTLFPVNAPNCNVAIAQPEIASGHYFNADCTAAYVLPAKAGSVRVEALSDVTNLDMCPGLRRTRLRVENYARQLERLAARLDDSSLSEARQEQIRKNMEVIEGLMLRSFDNYKDVPAATVQLSFTHTPMLSLIGEYLKYNPNLGADYRLRFHPAPISDGVIVFSSLDQAANIRLSPVVRASIPGMRPTADPAKFEGTAVFANGGVSGQLVMSLAGICPSSLASDAAEVAFKNGVVTDQFRQNLVANMVANFNYTVPVLESASYRGELDSDVALRNLASKWEERTQFTVRQGGELFSEGSAGLAFRFEITNYGNRTNEEERNSFGGTLRQEVQARLSAALVEQMAIAGFLEMSAPAPDATAPAPGTEDQTHIRRECRHRSGFLGIGGSSHCYDVPYTIKVPRGSNATVLLSKVNNTTFRNVEEAIINTVSHHKHSGTFLPVRN